MSARVKDVNGFYEVPRNPLSKVGVFPYTKKSIGYPGWENDPGGIVQVYRPAEELGHPDTVKSFRLLPWVDDHAMLGDPTNDPTLTPVEQKGAHGTIGEQVEYDPNDRTLYGNIKLWSSSLADAVDAGKKELSMGFRCVYEFVAGIFEGAPFQAIQRTIRGNHQASVDHGRMGPGVAVLDHFSFAFDASELREVKPMAKVARRVNVAAKLGVAVAALPAYFGMDAADVDAKTLAKFNATMDAEEDKADETDTGGSGDLTISQAAEIISEVAAPLGELQDALATLAGGGENPENPDDNMTDEMEPVVDATTGAPVMDEFGKPKMQKKAKAPATDATMTATDAAVKVAKAVSSRMHKSFPTAKPAGLAAMDSAISKTEKTMTNIRAYKPAAPRAAGNGLDARVATLENKPVLTMDEMVKSIASRDKLATRVSAFVGAFDHSEMTLDGVANYAAGKFGLTVQPATAVAQVEAYLHNRQPEGAAVGRPFGMDSAPAARPDVSGFVTGHSPAAQ